MFHQTFFPALSPSPLQLLIGIVIGAVVGIGFFNLYVRRHLRQEEQRLALLLPEGRRVHFTSSSWIFWALMVIVVGVLFFVSVLLTDFSDNGTLFTRETLELVVTCIVATLLFALVPIWLVRRSRTRLERRLGVVPPQQQTARSGPQPKETREEYGRDGK